MKQLFSKSSHDKFKKYFNIKKSPGKWDRFYIKKTIKYIKYISWMPGLKMVGVGNSISMNCSTIDSDIDLFIVSSPNTMWLNRILITLIFTILGVRKTSKRHAGMFCLSFFSTTSGLNFGNFALKNDIYLYFWIIYFKPILNYDNTYELFIRENEKWADFDNFLTKNNNITFSKQTNKDIKILNIILKKVDSILKAIFLPKTLKHYEKLGKPFGVIINDNMLKFHDKDVRKELKINIKSEKVPVSSY